MDQINMLAGHRINFRGPHPIKNKNMLAGHVLPTLEIKKTKKIQCKNNEHTNYILQIQY